MTNAACLALIIYFESRSENDLTQRYVAQVAMNKSDYYEESICKNLNRQRVYSFMFDGKPEVITENDSHKKAIEIANHSIKNRTLDGYLYFNECRLGRKYKTDKKMIRTKKLCFY